MNEFDPYKKYTFDPGFSEPADFLGMKDEKNKRILMEEQYNLLQIQKNRNTRSTEISRVIP